MFDTNAILSLWAFTDSRFAPLCHAVESGHWRALTRLECLAEYRRVLGYAQFAFDIQRQQTAYDAYVAQAECWNAPAVADAIVLPRCKDRDDQKFLELARDAGAALLVTSDKALLRLARRDKLKGLFRILKPEDALSVLEADRLLFLV